MSRYLEVVRSFARKDIRIAWSYRGTFIVGAFAIFYQLVIFRFVSKLVGGGRVIGTPDAYFRYVVVGIILTGVLRALPARRPRTRRRDRGGGNARGAGCTADAGGDAWARLVGLACV